MNKLFYIAALLALAACQKSEDPSKLPANAVAAPAKQELTIDEKRAIIRPIVDRSNTVEVDKFKGVTFWTSRPPIEGRSASYFYVTETQTNPDLIFRIVYAYIGEEWIFFDRIEILADDIKVVDRRLASEEEPARKVVSSKVLEVVDLVMSENDMKAFDKIAGAKTAVIRFSGKGQKDIPVSALEKLNFAKMVEMYDASRKLHGLEPIGFPRRTKGNDSSWKVLITVYSKKQLNEIKSKSVGLGIEVKATNIVDDAWLITGPVRQGYLAAVADSEAFTNATTSAPKIVVTKHISE